MQEIRGGRAKRRPERADAAERDDQRLGPELPRVDAGVHRPRAAIGEDGEVAWIIALVDGDLPDQVGHLVLDDPRRSARRLDHAHAEPLGDRLEALPRGAPIETEPAAEKVVRIEITEATAASVTVGSAPPRAVADGAGQRASRERPDAQAPARLVDPDDAAAAAADRADVDARHEVLVLVDDALVARHRAAIVDEPHVERRPAHIGRDHVLLAEDGTEILRGEHARHRPGVEGEEGPARRLRRGHDAASALHHLHGGAQARTATRSADALHVGAGDRPRYALMTVAAVRSYSPQRGTRSTEQQTKTPGAMRSTIAFTRRSCSGRLNDQRKQIAMASSTLGHEPADGGLGLLLVQLDHDLALAVDALADLGDEGLGHDGRIGLVALREVQDLFAGEAGHAARAPHDVDDVAMPSGGDEPDLGAAPLEQRIGPHRRAEGQARGPAEQRLGGQPELVRGDGQRVEHALGEVAGRGRRLRGDDAPVRVHQHAIGEGAARVDPADELAGHGLCRAPR